MRPVIGAVALGALAVGGAVVLATSRHSSNAQANQLSTPPAAVAPATAPAPELAPAVAAAPAAVPAVAQPGTGAAVAAPVAQRTVYRNGVTYRTTAPRHGVVRHTRSTKKSIAIIGGSTVGGAVVGGLVGGKKGAVVGGLVGGAAGTVYDRKTRHKVSRY